MSRSVGESNHDEFCTAQVQTKSDAEDIIYTKPCIEDDQSRHPASEDSLDSKNTLDSRGEDFLDIDCFEDQLDADESTSEISEGLHEENLEPWAVLRDTILHWPGPERKDVDRYRDLCSHRY
jgi:hypothetical protein